MKKGFTLIELMIVIVIIGILTAIAIPNFIKLTDRAKKASLIGNMHTIQVIVEDYCVVTEGKYPKHVSEIDSLLPQNIKNPFIPDGPVLQDYVDPPTTPGVVQYLYKDSAGVGDWYEISGIYKDSMPIELTLHPGKAIF